MVDDWGEVVTR